MPRTASRAARSSEGPRPRLGGVDTGLGQLAIELLGLQREHVVHVALGLDRQRVTGQRIANPANALDRARLLFFFLFFGGRRIVRGRRPRADPLVTSRRTPWQLRRTIRAWREGTFTTGARTAKRATCMRRGRARLSRLRA
jgi:hypothetical protein